MFRFVLAAVVVLSAVLCFELTSGHPSIATLAKPQIKKVELLAKAKAKEGLKAAERGLDKRN